MESSLTQAIDVHGHYGRYHRDENLQLKNDFMSGDATTVMERARLANTQITIVSPSRGLFPRLRADAFLGNEEAARDVEQTSELLQWVIIDPGDPRTFQQAAEMLGSHKCVGIKIHPEEHGYPITEHGPKIFEFAASHRALMLAHSGEQNSLPEDFVPLANNHPEVSLILGHHGNGWDGDPTHQVRGIQASRHGNVFVDTSSAQSIMPGLIEWGVREVGADRFLYGSDTPTYFAPMQRIRIDQADLSDHDKRQILRDNAVRLLTSHGKCQSMWVD